MKQTDNINCGNAACLFKNKCSSKWREQSTYQSGQHIFNEDIPVKGLYILQKGTVKEYYLEKNGMKKTIHIVRNGEIFGHKDYYGAKHLFSAVAIEDTQICFFNNRTLKEVCLSNAELSNNLMNFFSHELGKSDNKRKNYFNTL